MTSRQSVLTSWKRVFPAQLLLLWMISVSSHPVFTAPPPPDIIEGTELQERWLADGSFYDYDYLGDQPQADGYGPVANDLCPPVPKRLPLGGCDVEACSSDRECAQEELKCCYNGCVYTCLPEVKPPPFIDWIREPMRRLQFGQSWLVPGPDDNIEVEPCSTTPLDDDSDPLVCPTGYECSIEDAGNPREGIPNRGHCVKAVDDATSESLHFGVTPSQDNPEEDGQWPEDTAAYHACDLGDKQMLLSGHSVSMDGRECLCYETRLICDD